MRIVGYSPVYDKKTCHGTSEKVRFSVEIIRRYAYVPLVAYQSIFH